MDKINFFNRICRDSSLFSNLNVSAAAAEAAAAWMAHWEQQQQTAEAAAATCSQCTLSLCTSQPYLQPTSSTNLDILGHRSADSVAKGSGG